MLFYRLNALYGQWRQGVAVQDYRGAALNPGGHSKPASHGHLKTGHLDSSLVG